MEPEFVWRRKRIGINRYVVFQLAARIVTDAGREANLMIDRNKRRIFGSQGVRKGWFD
jgi:hypothetical protein